METVESLKRKIRTAEDLHSVVKTMKALAAVNIRQCEKAVDSLAEYNRTVEMGIQVLMRNRPEAVVLNMSEPGGRAGAIIFGSDQGMCGQLNDQIVSYVLSDIRDRGIEESIQKLLAVGLRASAHMEDEGYIADDTLSVPGSISGVNSMVQELVMIVQEWHFEKEIDTIFLFYNRPVSGASYSPTTVRLLPVDWTQFRTLTSKNWPTHVLPAFTMEWNELLSSVIRQYLFVSLYRASAESLTSENASRLASMQNAERNIEELLSALTSRFHQTRQATITEELFDVVSGFEALKE